MQIKIKKVLTPTGFEPWTSDTQVQGANHYTIGQLYPLCEVFAESLSITIVIYLCWARALWTAAFPSETEMALALLGRGSLHPLTTWGENLGVRAYPETVRYWELPHPERARGIRRSIYYVEIGKIMILGLDQQFSPNNKHFFVHMYFQKKYCSFSFLRPKFSFGMLFRQFGNFPKSSCQHTVA